MWTALCTLSHLVEELCLRSTQWRPFKWFGQTDEMVDHIHHLQIEASKSLPSLWYTAAQNVQQKSLANLITATVCSRTNYSIHLVPGNVKTAIRSPQSAQTAMWSSKTHKMWIIAILVRITETGSRHSLSKGHHHTLSPPQPTSSGKQWPGGSSKTEDSEILGNRDVGDGRNITLRTHGHFYLEVNKDKEQVL